MALIIPSEFTKSLESDEVPLELKHDENNIPHLTITPAESELDSIENDPHFAVFIKALYNDAMKHPERLHTDEEFLADFKELMEGVNLDED